MVQYIEQELFERGVSGSLCDQLVDMAEEPAPRLEEQPPPRVEVEDPPSPVASPLPVASPVASPSPVRPAVLSPAPAASPSSDQDDALGSLPGSPSRSHSNSSSVQGTPERSPRPEGSQPELAESPSVLDTAMIAFREERERLASARKFNKQRKFIQDREAVLSLAERRKSYAQHLAKKTEKARIKAKKAARRRERDGTAVTPPKTNPWKGGGSAKPSGSAAKSRDVEPRTPKPAVPKQSTRSRSTGPRERNGNSVGARGRDLSSVRKLKTLRKPAAGAETGEKARRSLPVAEDSPPGKSSRPEIVTAAEDDENKPTVVPASALPEEPTVEPEGPAVDSEEEGSDSCGGEVDAMVDEMREVETVVAEAEAADPSEPVERVEDAGAPEPGLDPVEVEESAEKAAESEEEVGVVGEGGDSENQEDAEMMPVPREIVDVIEPKHNENGDRLTSLSVPDTSWVEPETDPVAEEPEPEAAEVQPIRSPQEEKEEEEIEEADAEVRDIVVAGAAESSETRGETEEMEACSSSPVAVQILLGEESPVALKIVTVAAEVKEEEATVMVGEDEEVVAAAPEDPDPPRESMAVDQPEEVPETPQGQPKEEEREDQGEDTDEEESRSFSDFDDDPHTPSSSVSGDCDRLPEPDSGAPVDPLLHPFAGAPRSLTITSLPSLDTANPLSEWIRPMSAHNGVSAWGGTPSPPGSPTFEGLRAAEGFGGGPPPPQTAARGQRAPPEAETESPPRPEANYASMYDRFEEVFCRFIGEEKLSEGRPFSARGKARGNNSSRPISARRLQQQRPSYTDRDLVSFLERHRGSLFGWLKAFRAAEAGRHQGSFQGRLWGGEGEDCGEAEGRESAGQEESCGSKMVYKVTDDKPEVYKLVTASFHTIGEWREDPTDDPESPHWNVLWSWSSKPKVNRADLNIWQRVNHYPGAFELTRKDALKRNLAYCKSLFKPDRSVYKLFDVMPRTYALPQEYVQFCNAFSEGITFEKQDPGKKTRPRINYGSDNTWIMKPVCSSRGRGIFLINSIEEVEYGEAFVIQKYVDKPLLIHRHKFDLRLYVLVTCFNPLEAWLYREGFARFCQVPYSTEKEDLKDKFVHLTNSSVQQVSFAFSAANRQYGRQSGLPRNAFG